MTLDLTDAKPIGYKYLVQKYKIICIPHWHNSYLSGKSRRETETVNGFTTEIYSSKNMHNATDPEHLEFAIKHDGINLCILSKYFVIASESDITKYIKSKPTSKYVRKIWFLYEFLTEKRLPIEDLKIGNYVPILDEGEYFTIQNAKNVQRYRIINNLPGTREYCPIIRITPYLTENILNDIQTKCTEIIDSYSPNVLKRAIAYFYRKETKSSFEIEHIKPEQKRISKFIAILEKAGDEDFINKKDFISLQNQLVDSRFANDNFRTNQNYIGESVSHNEQIIHYISPKPEDINALMNGLFDCHNILTTGKIEPIIHAAAISYAFVFFHPFEDANGRIHRFIIHNILKIRNFIPKNIMFPISAVMLQNLDDYDNSLEAFSKPLMKLIDYEISGEGAITVKNDTAVYYKYPDLTFQAEALLEFINKTIDNELKKELDFIINYDNAKSGIQEIIDMPDNKIDLLIKFCLQNDGYLSKNKREKYFDFLTKEEISSIESVIKTHFFPKTIK